MLDKHASVGSIPTPRTAASEVTNGGPLSHRAFPRPRTLGVVEAGRMKRRAFLGSGMRVLSILADQHSTRCFLVSGAKAGAG